MSSTSSAFPITLAGGLALGWRPTEGLMAFIAALGLLLWFRLGLQAFAVWAGLRASGPEAVVAAQILVWPISMVSTVFIDPATMPGWLGVIAEANPLSATVTAVRDLLGTPLVAGETWASEHALLLALVLPAVFILVFTPLAARALPRTVPVIADGQAPRGAYMITATPTRQTRAPTTS